MAPLVESSLLTKIADIYQTNCYVGSQKATNKTRLKGGWDKPRFLQILEKNGDLL